MTNISVIVTTYNRPKLLKETLDSILNQTYVDFELIVVDNNSNYDFFKLIESFNDNRIIAYQNENDGVIAVNRNFGIRKSKGKYIAFCDDDDTWTLDKLKSQLKYLKNDKFDLIYSNTNLIFQNGSVKLTNYTDINSLSRLLRKNHITLSSVIVKKTNILLFNDNKSLVTVEDYELWIRLMQDGLRFKFIQQPLVNWRVSDKSMSRKSKSNNEKVNLKFRIFLLRKYKFPFNLKLILLYIIIIRFLKFLTFKLYFK